MFRFASLVATVLLAVSSSVALPVQVPQDPLAVLPLSVRFNITNGKLPDIDRARAHRLFEIGRAKQRALTGEVSDQAGLSKRAASLSVTNDAVAYVANVNIGSPATSYSLLIDTGSSNTWVGSGKKYIQTNSSTNTGKPVAVSYGSGSFSGTEYTDTVSFGPGLTIEKQSIGVASTSHGFGAVDGILGIGPVNLTESTVTGEDRVPTVSDNLRAQGQIDTEVLAISFNPTTSRTPTTNGEMTFGGTDPSKYTGAISYTPLTTIEPSASYWGIEESLAYGSGTKHWLMPSAAGIIDTGTTLVLIASDAFKQYQAQTGATLDSRTGLLSVTMDQYKRMLPLTFLIGGSRFELSPNAQIWPRALNSYIGGAHDGIYLIVADIGMDSGSGMDFINGYTFLERFYSVYDTTNSQFGIATTANTMATTN